jgi:hypothetical protein
LYGLLLERDATCAAQIKGINVQFLVFERQILIVGFEILVLAAIRIEHVIGKAFGESYVSVIDKSPSSKAKCSLGA